MDCFRWGDMADDNAEYSFDVDEMDCPFNNTFFILNMKKEYIKDDDTMSEKSYKSDDVLTFASLDLDRNKDFDEEDQNGDTSCINEDLNEDTNEDLSQNKNIYKTQEIQTNNNNCSWNYEDYLEHVLPLANPFANTFTGKENCEEYTFIHGKHRDPQGYIHIKPTEDTYYEELGLRKRNTGCEIFYAGKTVTGVNSLYWLENVIFWLIKENWTNTKYGICEPAVIKEFMTAVSKYPEMFSHQTVESVRTVRDFFGGRRNFVDLCEKWMNNHQLWDQLQVSNSWKSPVLTEVEPSQKGLSSSDRTSSDTSTDNTSGIVINNSPVKEKVMSEHDIKLDDLDDPFVETSDDFPSSNAVQNEIDYVSRLFKEQTFVSSNPSDYTGVCIFY